MLKMDSFGLDLTISGHANSVATVAYSPDGSKLASGSHDNTIKVWNMSIGARGTLLLTIPNVSPHIGSLWWVQSVAFSPDGQNIASGASHGPIKIWDAESGDLIHTLDMINHYGISSVAYSPDGRNIACANGGTIKVLDIENGGALLGSVDFTNRTIVENEHSDYAKPTSVAYSPDGSKLASGSESKRENTLNVWNVKDGISLFRNFRIHGPPAVSAVAFSPDGLMLASGYNDGTIRVWDVLDGTLLHTFGKIQETEWGTWYAEDSVRAVAYSPDGRNIVSGKLGGSIQMWDTDHNESQYILSSDGYGDEVYSVAFGPDGRSFVSGSGDEQNGGKIKVWRHFCDIPQNHSNTASVAMCDTIPSPTITAFVATTSTAFVANTNPSLTITAFVAVAICISLIGGCALCISSRKEGSIINKLKARWLCGCDVEYSKQPKKNYKLAISNEECEMVPIY